MFVCGHPRHNAQSIIGHINLSIIMFIKFTTSKRLPSSLIGDIIVRGMQHTIKISNNSLGCLSHHTAHQEGCHAGAEGLKGPWPLEHAALEPVAAWGVEALLP